MAPEPETTKDISSNYVISLKAANFLNMAFKLSMEINTDPDTISTKISFLKVLYNVCKIGKKNINFEQFARLHLDGPEIVICETASKMVFILISSFTSKDIYFRMAIAEACETFNKTFLHFGYTQKIELFDPKTYQVNPPQTHPFC